jgi:opacity protein-like surface antigen
MSTHHFQNCGARSFVRVLTCVGIFSLLASSTGIAQAESTNAPAEKYTPPPTIKLEPEQSDYLNRIGLNYRMGLNISVDFHKLGGLALSDPGPARGSAVNRHYDNGYNLVDSSTNAGGYTWYWGYSSPNSVQGGNLALQSDATLSNASSNDRRDDPQNGVELTYQRELIRRKHWRGGLEAALGYTFISVKDSRTLLNTVYRTNDSFNLNGVIPPTAPYFGGPSNAAVLISSEPASRTTEVLPNAATITGDRQIDTHLFTIRLGPYVEFPINDRLNIYAEGGLTLAIADTKFSFHETVTISDPTYDINLVSEPRSGSGSQTDFAVGGYVGGGVSYALTKQLSLVGGVEFQAAGREVNHVQGKESILDLGKAFIISLGVSYSF